MRVNDLTTAWTYRDVLEVVEGAGADLDTIVLPKVSTPQHVAWLDLTLSQLERALGLQVGRIGIEPQIEDAAGLVAVDGIAAGPRVEAVARRSAMLGFDGKWVLHPGQIDAANEVFAPSQEDYDHADAYHYPLMRILTAARAAGVQAIDGPYLQIRDVDGFRRLARRTAALGYDGKWVLHPGQIEAANEVFSPSQQDFDHAELILDAYDFHTRVRQVGAVMLGEEMIDEASRKMAAVVAAQGRAAGMSRTSTFTPPD